MTITEDLAHRAEALEREAAAVRKLIEAAEQLGDEQVVALFTRTNGNGNGHTNGNGHIEVPEDAPRGREAIRVIVREKPGVWTLANLRAELQRRGWFTSNKGVDVAVTRLTRSGEAKRVGKGRYVFPAPEVGDAP